MKYVILGAGPAGLTIGNMLLRAKETSFVILEKEAVAGGLCRSTLVDGAPFDIGGGHFLDVRRPAVNRFLFEFMPESEWDQYDRVSKIRLGAEIVDHPIEANIWQMNVDSQVEYLASIARAGCVTGSPMPEKFVDWIYWKLGDRIADEYMIPYNRKLFSDDLDSLGTYWLDKLPSVSFEETLRSCLTHRAYGAQPGHARFYYPKKYGYGELWLRLAGALDGHIEYGADVKAIDFDAKAVQTADGRRFAADRIITTIPWAGFTRISGMPEDIRSGIRMLRHSAVETRYYGGRLDTDAHWIYEPDPWAAHHRILVRHNFCPGSRGYWTETRSDRIGLIPEGGRGNYHYENPYAYPLNTIGKPAIIRRLLDWAASRGVYGVGRWGEHQHYNSDATVELAMKMAERMQM